MNTETAMPERDPGAPGRAAVARKDASIRVLWRELAFLSDHHSESLTDEDARLFAKVAMHKAVQSRLRRSQ